MIGVARLLLFPLLLLAAFAACNSASTPIPVRSNVVHETNEVLAAFGQAIKSSPDLDNKEDVEFKKQYLEFWLIGLLTLGSTERVAEGTYRVTFRFDPYDSNTKETWDFYLESAKFQPVDAPALSSATLLFCPSTPLCATYQEMWLQIGNQLGN